MQIRFDVSTLVFYIWIVLSLDDKDLPCVPAISIKVPYLYPEKPPNCSIDILEYSSSSFFQDVQQNFAANLNKLPEYYSITSLLNSWVINHKFIWNLINSNYNLLGIECTTSSIIVNYKNGFNRLIRQNVMRCWLNYLFN